MFRQFFYNLLRPLINREVSKKNKFFYFLRELFGKFFMPEKSVVLDFYMYLHKSGHSFELAFENGYELLEINFLKKLNLKNKIAIDIGSCLGYYALVLSKLVGGGKVLAFEPEEKNFQLLEKNIKLNRLLNIFPFKLAVGNRNGVIFFEKKKSPGQHSVYKNVSSFNQRRKRVKIKMVEVVRLDDFLKHKEIDTHDLSFVKIDVEGYEFEVLKGMVGIFMHSKDIIVQLEFAPQHLVEQGCSSEQFIDFIKQLRLKIYYWDLKLERLLQIADFAWLAKTPVIREFERGVLYSRNLILAKAPLVFDCVVREIKVKEMLIKSNRREKFYLPSILIDFKIPVDTPLKLPDSGRFFIEALKEINFQNKKVLDIGTGYFGFLAHQAKYFGAKEVVAIDLNSEAVIYAKRHFWANDIDYRVGDVYSALKMGEKFDIILSNPPQLPSKSKRKIHDFGGKDGLEVIRKIIEDFSVYSNTNGRFYLLLFDFLLDSVKKFCEKSILEYSILAYYNKKIRKGGETEKEMDYIEQIYFPYRFKHDGDSWYFRVFILEIKRV